LININGDRPNDLNGKLMADAHQQRGGRGTIVNAGCSADSTIQ
jgi:hypothetical protein